ncbi:PqqD family protein [Vagococcus intermedius]|uniref:PqqD family protein n=1 Tax=Vagococcus intermedius TaxID=2991418 RepID=A0AAF0CUB1_9ENTE|nr:PqqD family protein [Vagococcus intermedius]WEG73040.1 PqqD family protein [Vagococcus intermedius]WEG75125.1 PqqD family protein [Vagococcus intermedius]
MTEELEDFLTIVYQINPEIEHRLDDQGMFVIVKPQNHWIQRFFRKLYVKIPMETMVTMDAYGSFVMKQIDGKTSIEEIGKRLESEYEEAGVHLYERLQLYINHLEVREGWIQPIARLQDKVEDN